MSKNFQELTNILMLTNNDFIRTTSEQHKNGARHFWTSLSEKDEIYLDKYSGWYSIRDEAYYQENELIEGRAPTGSSVDWVEEASYFFRLSKVATNLYSIFILKIRTLYILSPGSTKL